MHNQLQLSSLLISTVRDIQEEKNTRCNYRLLAGPIFFQTISLLLNSSQTALYAGSYIEIKLGHVTQLTDSYIESRC